MIRHTWITDDQKSKAASRKIIYYETDAKGDIHTVIVPSIPEDDPECKIKILHDFDSVSYTHLDVYKRQCNIYAIAEYRRGKTLQIIRPGSAVKA